MTDYTITNVSETKDVTGDAPGQMNMMGQNIDSGQVAITYRLIPAGYKPAHGHTHSAQDEVIFIIKGNLTVKLNDQIEIIGPKDVLRIHPETKRGYHNDGDEDVEMIIASVQGELVDDNGGTPDENWWPAES